MLRQNPILPIIEKALGTPCGFSEDRRKVYFSVEETVENVRSALVDACKEIPDNINVDATFYVLPSYGRTIVQLDN